MELYTHTDSEAQWACHVTPPYQECDVPRPVLIGSESILSPPDQQTDSARASSSLPVPVESGAAPAPVARGPVCFRRLPPSCRRFAGVNFGGASS